jgi:hypothetical protein
MSPYGGARACWRTTRAVWRVWPCQGIMPEAATRQSIGATIVRLRYHKGNSGDMVGQSSIAVGWEDTLQGASAKQCFTLLTHPCF